MQILQHYVASNGAASVTLFDNNMVEVSRYGARAIDKQHWFDNVSEAEEYFNNYVEVLKA